MSKKILMLHGFAQSASIYSAKTGGLRKALTKAGYETIYLDAPLKLAADETHNPDTDSDLYGWWEYGSPQYTIDDALRAIDDKIGNDEIEGIIGFSQGAGLGGYIAAEYLKLMPSLKFAVLFSGFPLVPDQYQQAYINKIQLPTLHVIGELDTVVEEGRTSKLYNAAEESKRTMLKHQGGHFVPNSKSYVDKVMAWIAAQTTETQETKKSDINDDDMFAAIDNLGKA